MLVKIECRFNQVHLFFEQMEDYLTMRNNVLYNNFSTLPVISSDSGEWFSQSEVVFHAPESESNQENTIPQGQVVFTVPEAS